MHVCIFFTSNELRTERHSMSRPLFHSHPIVRRALADLEVPHGCVGVHGTLYDVQSFGHPGGALWMDLVSGTDATELFEMSHLNISLARRALDRLPTKGTYQRPVQRDYTTYARLRAIVANRAPDRDPPEEHEGACFQWIWGAIAAHLVLVASRPFTYQWTGLCIVASLCNSVLGGYGHDALHRLHPRALLLDWNGLSSYEWLLEHVVSHHPHVNTKHDHDACSMEPIVRWNCPRWSNLVAYPLFSIGEIVVTIHGFVGHRCRWKAPPRAPAWLRLAPWMFVARVVLHLAFQGIAAGAATLAFTLCLASTYFSYLAHLSHAPGGDGSEACVVRHQLRHTADIATDWPQLMLFLDRQTMHHLFPTVPHARLDATMRAALSRVLGPGSEGLVPRHDLPRVLHRRLARVPPRGKELPPPIK